MGKLSRLGNALYEGDVSIDFVGRKWLWYAISGIIVAARGRRPLLQGPQLRHRVRGRRRVQRHAPGRPGHPGQRRQDRVTAVADTGIDAASSPIVNTSGKSHPGADRGAEQRRGRQGHRPPSPRRSASTRGRHLRPGRRRELGRAGRQARPDRARRVPGPRGAVHLGLLPRVEDVRGRHRRARPRHRDHHRRLRALRVRGHPGHRHRPADHPRVLALRHRRRLRQGPGEHQEPAAEPIGRTPSWPTSR